jgi:hypothetical protein
MLDIFTGSLGGMEPLLMGAGGFAMKLMAQSQANKAEEMKWALQGLGAKTDAANAAQDRGGPGGAWVRRFIVFAVFSTLFGGAFMFGWFDNIQTVYAYTTPVKERLFGLFQGGGKVKTLATDGFLMTPEMWRLAIDISFFYFGAGIAKAKR